MHAGGPTLVFVPGFMQREDAWRAVAERLGEPYRSVCLDHDSWTVEERVAEVRAASPPGTVVVGYSLGGRIALQSALEHPGRFAGLVLVGASAGIDDDEERARRRAADETLADWVATQPIEAVVESWESQPVFASQPPGVVEAQRPGRLSHDPERLAELLRSAGQGAMDPVWHRLPQLDMPLLAVAGELDTHYVQVSRRVAAVAPRGSARVIANAGHAPHLEQPEAFAELLREFLHEHLG